MNEELRQAIGEAARELDVQPASLAAVADIESGLQAFALVDGRPRPLIRFEGHYFDRRLSDGSRQRAHEAGLASPVAGAIANPASQAARWRLLAQAAAIDRRAAYESTSWGLGQVMGAHWAWLDYASVDALADDAASVAGQMRLMKRYIVKAGLAGALRGQDWTSFAHGYNGPAFRRNNYHIRLQQAFERHSGSWARTPTSSGQPLLRRRARGEPVKLLQSALRASGATLEVDGIFGPVTKMALRDFQIRKNLAADGIAGPRSWAALEPYIAVSERDENENGWRSIGGILANMMAIFRTSMRI